MPGKHVALVGIALTSLALGGIALAQDKYSVRPTGGGLAFTEFKGFEHWETVAVSHAGDMIEVILGNPTIIKAYQSGVPGNGKDFPDGSKLAKIHWMAKQSAEAPSATTVPGALHDIDLMARDSKRFRDTGNWGYTQYNYDPAKATFTALEPGSKCGFACHTTVASKDYVFTAYGPR